MHPTLCHLSPFSTLTWGALGLWHRCDHAFKEHMTREECIDFVVQALDLAMSRDASSGGIQRVAIASAGGVERYWLKHQAGRPTALAGVKPGS